MLVAPVGCVFSPVEGVSADVALVVVPVVVSVLLLVAGGAVCLLPDEVAGSELLDSDGALVGSALSGFESGVVVVVVVVLSDEGASFSFGGSGVTPGIGRPNSGSDNLVSMSGTALMASSRHLVASASWPAVL